MYSELSNNILLEMTYAELKDKQRDIVRLFPAFWDRVNAVARNGGVTLAGEEKGILEFLVTSGTTKGKHYVIRVQFENIPEAIKQAAKDVNNWTSDKNRLNLNKISHYVLYNTDLKISSDSPGDLWWGHNTIRTDNDAELDNQNNVQPNVRNPEKLGIMGKHVALVWRTLPFYANTLASHIKKYFKEDVAAAEKEGLKARYNPKDKEEQVADVEGMAGVKESKDIDVTEKEQYFIERTNKHIKRVIEAAKRINEAYPELKVLEGIESHDHTKFQEPQRTPYIDLTWNKFKGIKEVNPRINEVTLLHITSEDHHPEFWNRDEANLDDNNRDKSKVCLNAEAMPDKAIAHMVADWEAMSEELKTNTARQWHESTKDVRWHWSKHQEKLIDKLLTVFE